MQTLPSDSFTQFIGSSGENVNAAATISHPPLSEAKRKLLGKFLSGDLQPTVSDQQAITRRPSDAIVPLSLAQEQIWSVLQSNPAAPPLYNEFITIHRHGHMDVAALQRALTEIVRRHEAWRTTFHPAAQYPVQVVAPPPEKIPLAVIDLRGSSRSTRDREAALVAAIEARIPFDLAKGPLLRAALIQLDDEEYRLHLTFHQLIVDGLSVFRILPSELVTLYEAFVDGEASPLAALPVQFGDFACWQRRMFTSELLHRQLTYWKNHLSGCPPAVDWPKGISRPATPTFRGAIHPKLISNELALMLRARSQEHGVSLFMTLLAGFAALLHLYSEQDDIIIGTLTASGRHRPEVKDLLGYFMNPLPLRLRFQDDPTFAQLLSQAREVTSGALANDDVPLHYLLNEMPEMHHPDRHPFFQVALSLAPELPLLPPGWDQTFMDFESGAARWDLYLEFNQRPNGLMLRAQYNPDILSLSAVEKTLQDLEVLLEAATSNPTVPISGLRGRRL
jgi:Condensation domain